MFRWNVDFIYGKSAVMNVAILRPNFQVHDLFADLGPVAVFNARNYWSAPREVRLRKKDRQVRDLT